MTPRKGTNDMFLQQLPDADIKYHNQRVQSGYASAQKVISVAGLREIVGSTFIHMGSKIHGKAKDVCQEAEQRRLSAHMFRRSGALAK